MAVDVDDEQLVGFDLHGAIGTTLAVAHSGRLSSNLLAPSFWDRRLDTRGLTHACACT